MLHRPRNIMRTVAFCSLFLATGLVPALAADPTGDWRVADGVANIRVAECNGSMWGAVAWEKTPGGRDTNNPDVSKQNRPTLGMPILIDMKKKPAVDQWEGQVYNAKDGQMYVDHDQAGRLRSDGDSRLRAGLPLRRRNLDPRRGPIPSSPANSMAKGAPKTVRFPGRPRSSQQLPRSRPRRLRRRPRAPSARLPKPAQKQAAGQPGDIGDICLLPDIARFAH